MYCYRQVTEDIAWIGGNDRRIALFENVYPVPAGMSYNAYFVSDEKTMVIDTVDHAVADVFFENIRHLLAGRKLDYLVVNIWSRIMRPPLTTWCSGIRRCRSSAGKRPPR